MTPKERNALTKRLDAIETAVKNPPRSLRQGIAVPVIGWIAAIAAAILTAWFTTKFETDAAGRAKDAETRAEMLAKNEVELYGHLSVLREKVCVGFERFIKTKGRHDVTAEDASKTLYYLLQTQKDIVPSTVERPLRELNNYVNSKKAELSSVPKSEWYKRTDALLKEAEDRNQTVRRELSAWFQSISASEGTAP
jgi:hypothetical protein